MTIVLGVEVPNAEIIRAVVVHLRSLLIGAAHLGSLPAHPFMSDPHAIALIDSSFVDVADVHRVQQRIASSASASPMIRSIKWEWEVVGVSALHRSAAAQVPLSSTTIFLQPSSSTLASLERLRHRLYTDFHQAAPADRIEDHVSVCLGVFPMPAAAPAATKMHSLEACLQCCRSVLLAQGKVLTTPTVSRSVVIASYHRADVCVLGKVRLGRASCAASETLKTALRQNPIAVDVGLRERCMDECRLQAVKRATLWLRNRLGMKSMPTSRDAWLNVLRTFEKVPVRLSVDRFLQQFLSNGFIRNTTMNRKSATETVQMIHFTKSTNQYRYKKVAKGYKTKPDEVLKSYPVYHKDVPAFEVQYRKLGSTYDAPSDVPASLDNPLSIQVKIKRCLKHMLLSMAKAKHADSSTEKSKTLIVAQDKFKKVLEDASVVTVVVKSEVILDALLANGVLVLDSVSSRNGRSGTSSSSITDNSGGSIRPNTSKLLGTAS